MAANYVNPHSGYLSPTSRDDGSGKIKEHQHRADLRARNDKLLEAIFAYYRKYHAKAA